MSNHELDSRKKTSEILAVLDTSILLDEQSRITFPLYFDKGYLPFPCYVELQTLARRTGRFDSVDWVNKFVEVGLIELIQKKELDPIVKRLLEKIPLKQLGKPDIYVLAYSVFLNAPLLTKDRNLINHLMTVTRSESLEFKLPLPQKNERQQRNRLAQLLSSKKGSLSKFVKTPRGKAITGGLIDLSGWAAETFAGIPKLPPIAFLVAVIWDP